MDYQLKEHRFPLEENKNYTMVERVLINRGINYSDIKHYLNTTAEDILPPQQLSYIEDGVRMLVQHIANDDKVFMIVDCDADGFTSSALLINYLHEFFPAWVENKLEYAVHSGKQHGLKDFIGYIPADTKLVICADSATNDYEEHETLFYNKIDILILDHHEAEYYSPYACTINNQLCTNYSNKTLSGVGIVWKFCCLLDEYLDSSVAHDFLDLVAVGMVADMVPLTHFETRYIVNLGSKDVFNPLLTNMVAANEYSIQGELNPFKIAFYIAPYINATIRVGDLEEKLTLFEAMLTHKAFELVSSTKRGAKGELETRVTQAVRNCNNIKNRQTKIRDKDIEIIKNTIVKNNLTANKILTICMDVPVDKNLTGLIANELVAEYQQPVLLLNKKEEDGQLYWEGSGRGLNNSKLADFKDYLTSTGLVDMAEGHQGAFGCRIADQRLQSFIDYTNQDLKDMDFSPCYKVDFIVDANNFEAYQQELLEIAQLDNIWGQGVEQPKFAIENIKIHSKNLYLMSPDKKPTLKILLPDGTAVIKFRSSIEEFESLKSDIGCVTINIIGTCQKNVWNGNTTLQLLVEDYEVIGKTQYYF